MFKFRANAIKNDKELKNKLLLLSANQCTSNTTTNNASKMANLKAIQPTQSVKQSALKLENIDSVESSKSNIVHETVTKVLHQYSKMKIPRSCLKSNICPNVAINKDEVGNWFEEKRKRDLLKVKERLPRESIDSLSSTENEAVCVVPAAEKDVQENVSDDTIIVIEDVTNEELPANSNHPVPKMSEIPCKRKLEDPLFPYALPRKRKRSIDTTSSCSTDIDIEEWLKNVEKEKVETTKCGDEGTSSHELNDNHVCKICSLVVNSGKEMKAHIKKHLTCPFCKAKFKTFDSKTVHVEKDCNILTIMNNQPKIELVKAELVETLIKKYPRAFESLLGPKKAQYLDDIIEIDISEDDVYCISDDDDDDVISLHSPGDNSDKVVPEKSSSNVIGPSTSTKSKEVPQKCPADSVTTSVVGSTQKNVVTGSIRKEGPLVPQIDFTKNPNLNKINSIRDETELIKHLLNANRKKIDALPPPSGASIVMQGAGDKIYALKDMVLYLKKYKVPIDIHYGAKLTVSYEYESTKPINRKLDLWDPKKVAIPLTNPYSSRAAGSNVQQLPNGLVKVVKPSNLHVSDQTSQITIGNLLYSGKPTPGLNNKTNMSGNSSTIAQAALQVGQIPTQSKCLNNTTDQVLGMPSLDNKAIQKAIQMRAAIARGPPPPYQRKIAPYPNVTVSQTRQTSTAYKPIKTSAPSQNHAATNTPYSKRVVSSPKVPNNKSTQQSATVSTQQSATVSTPQLATVSTPQLATVSAPQLATVSAPQVATVSAPQVATVSAPQVATVSTPQVATVTSGAQVVPGASYVRPTVINSLNFQPVQPIQYVQNSSPFAYTGYPNQGNNTVTGWVTQNANQTLQNHVPTASLDNVTYPYINDSLLCKMLMTSASSSPPSSVSNVPLTSTYVTQTGANLPVIVGPGMYQPVNLTPAPVQTAQIHHSDSPTTTSCYNNTSIAQSPQNIAPARGPMLRVKSIHELVG